MTSIIAVGIVIALMFVLSRLVERVTGRSRKAFIKPGWFFVFYPLLVSGGILVYKFVPVDSPLLYAAYGLVGGLASLIAQGLYGVKPSKPSA